MYSKCHRKIERGNYDYQLDNGEFIKVNIKIDHVNREATIDFTGTAEKPLEL